ncbi:MAG: RnfABCDGE type electron transport complex subunit B [Duodenibacillus sp.]
MALSTAVSEHPVQSDPSEADAIARIEAVLPQTQCRQCGFDGCAQYARAIVRGEAAVNRCAPGGRAGVEILAALTGQTADGVDPEYGTEQPFAVARIRARECIGCALCAAACPVEAVSGVPKHLFGILESECTGCGLCVCACPVCAIEMQPVSGRVWTRECAAAAKQRYEAACARRRARKLAQQTQNNLQADDKAAILAAVLGRAKALAKR